MSEQENIIFSKQRAAAELGVTGLQRSSPWKGGRGIVLEEFLPELHGERLRRTLREMRDNDPVIGAMMFAIEMLLRNVEWRVEGGSEEHVEFVQSCLDDMTHTWSDFITEVLSMLVYGFSWHEVVYKRRNGQKDDLDNTSRFEDGKIGWCRWPIRSQDSLLEWVFRETGDVEAFVQSAPPSYERVEIPTSRSLLFRLGSHKNNPEGRSLLRNAWRPWLFKKHLEEIEAIGIERDLAGLPVIYMTSDLEPYRDEFKKILRNLRRDEQEGLLLPLVRDRDNNECLRFELVGSPGSRQIDIGTVIDRYDKRIAMTVMADFLFLGQQAVGSFALASSKTHLFASALGAILKSIAEPLNRFAIPRLMAVNGWKLKPEDLPQLVPGDVETPDLGELGSFVTALAGAGMPLFPDEKLENYLRTAANLPKRPEGDMLVPNPPQPKGEATAAPSKPKEETVETAGAPKPGKPGGKPAKVEGEESVPPDNER